MKIAICDDQLADIVIIRNELDKIVDDLHYDMEILELTDATAMVKEIVDAKVEVVLLDIDMPKITGLDIANQLIEQVPFINIIFLTNKTEFVFEAFKYRPLRFVRKNCIRSELAEAIQAAMEKISNELHIIEFQGERSARSFAVRDIWYIESSKHYIEIHMQSGIHRMRGRISDYERRLEEHGFIRIHVGYLVNVRYITSLSAKAVLISNGKQLPVSRKYAKDVFEKYAKGLERFVHGCNI